MTKRAAATPRRFDTFSAGIKEVALRNNGKYAGLPVSMPLEDAIFDTMVRTRSIA